MGDQAGLVTLSCPKHHQTLVSGLWKFFLGKHRADLEFQCGGRSIRAHQIIVEIFLQLGSSSRGVQEPAPPAAGSGNHIDALLEFMYNGCVTVPENLLNSLLKVAKELKFALLVEAVEWETTKRGDLRKSDSKRKGAYLDKRNATTKKSNLSKKAEDGIKEPLVKRQLRMTKSRAAQFLRADTVDDFEVAEGQSDEELQGEEATAADEAMENDDGDTKTCPVKRGHCSVTMSKAKSVTRRPRERQQVHRCSQCDYTTHLKDRFEVHRARHDPSSTIFSCSYCSQAFLCQETCEQHQSRHTLNRCSFCTFETMKNWQFYQHLFSVHKVNASGEPVEVKVKCPDCEFTCKLESQLRHHAREKHSGEKPFTCEHCSYASSRKSVLKRHVRLVHLGIRKEPSCMCEQCGQRCYNQFDLRTHKRSHTDEKPYNCKTCGKSYKYHSAFSRHLRRHTENDKPFICHVCGFSCSRQDNLRTHIKGVHKSEVEPERT